MISKQHQVKRAAGSCHYVLQAGDKRPKVLAAEGVRASSAEEMAADFEMQRSVRPRVCNAIEHITLAWPPGEAEKLSDEVMVQAAKRYLELRGIEPVATQWVLVRHHDQDHPHCHLLLNRVTNAGGLVPDKFSHLNGAAACRHVEGEMGFVNAAMLGTAQKLAKAEQAPESSPELVQRLRLRLYLAEALERRQPAATTIGQLQVALAQDQIALEPILDKQGKMQGAVLKAAAFPGLHMRASEVGRQYSGRQLREAIEAASLRESILTDRAQLRALQQVGERLDSQRVADLRDKEILPVEQRLLAAETQAASTMSGRAMLAKLRAAEDIPQATAAGQLPPMAATASELRTTLPAKPVVSQHEWVATTPVPGVNWQKRYEQYTLERRTICRHNWTVDRVYDMLNSTANADGIRATIAFVQKPDTPPLTGPGLLTELQRELRQQQEHEAEVSYVIVERARLEKEAKSFFGLSRAAIEAQDRLRYLEVPPALPLQIGPRRYRQPEPPELSKEAFVEQQQARLSKLSHAVAGVLDNGITGWDSFQLAAQRQRVKVTGSPVQGVSLQFEGDTQVYSAREVPPDFAKRYSQALTQGLAEAAQVQRTMGRSEGAEISR